MRARGGQANLNGKRPSQKRSNQPYRGGRSSRYRWLSSLDNGQRFYYSGLMESKTAINASSALAQDSRLQVYELLVEAGPAGLAASDIAERLGIPANTLSFHLKTSSHADLVHSRQEGRFVFYSTNYEQMNALLSFLTENCCGGQRCPVDCGDYQGHDP
jgi:ArsR family transcriptional regulator, arsenate/arsenite/antimonite-responsive transcriptional repressor